MRRQRYHDQPHLTGGRDGVGNHSSPRSLQKCNKNRGFLLGFTEGPTLWLKVWRINENHREAWGAVQSNSPDGVTGGAQWGVAGLSHGSGGTAPIREYPASTCCHRSIAHDVTFDPRTLRPLHPQTCMGIAVMAPRFLGHRVWAR